MTGKCYFLLPCQSLEQLPLAVEPTAAENFLVAWTTSWHPAILAATGQPPVLLSAECPSVESPNSIVFIPAISQQKVANAFIQKAQSEGTLILRAAETISRRELVNQALTGFPATAGMQDAISPELESDFFALAYAFLQVQIMTRQLRQSSNLKLEPFEQSLIQAAEATVAGNDESAQEQLSVCFDLLMEERNCYYPVRPQLIDLVLLADSTLGRSLDAQLTLRHTQSLLMTGSIAERLAAHNPAAIERVRDLLDEQKLVLIGGLNSETPDPLLSAETTIRQLTLAQLVFAKHFRFKPKVFCRREFGITSTLPALLEQFEFIGAMHVSLGGGQLPIGSSVNIRWSGIDGSFIQAHCGQPLDAANSSSLLGLGRMLGQQIDSTHTAVAFFAHWPNHYSQTFGDLIRIQKYAPVLGHFVHAEEYFDSLYDPGYGDRFELDEYRSPYLQEAIDSLQQNPISICIDYWQAHYLLLSCRALLVQSAVRLRWRCSSGTTRLPASSDSGRSFSEILTQIVALETQLDSAMARRDSMAVKQIESNSREQIQSIVQSHLNESSSENETFWSAINTLNFRRRAIVTEPIFKSPQKGAGAILFADGVSGNQLAVLEMNGTSSVILNHSVEPVSVRTTRDVLANEPAVFEGLSLKNEFFQLQVDPKHGGIKAFSNYQDRQNLLGQQLAVRIPEIGLSSSRRANHARYTQMVGESIETLSHSRISASILSQGRLVDGEKTVAKFRQMVTVTRGIPIAELTIELETTNEDGQPIVFNHPHHYLCNRLAWHDEAGEFSANFQDFRHCVSAQWLHATHFVQIEQGSQKVTLLTEGLPFHRRVSRKMLDSLLLVGNESRRKFRLGIGLNLPYPMLSAASRLTPPVLCQTRKTDLTDGLDDWLFHFDRKNVLVTWWEPEFSPTGQVDAVQLRCQETEGRSGELTITCRHPISTSSLTTCSGRFLRSLRFDPSAPNRITHHFNAYEHFQIRIQL